MKIWYGIFSSVKKWFENEMSEKIKLYTDHTFAKGNAHLEGQEIRVVGLAKAYHRTRKKLELCLTAASPSMEFLQVVIIPMIEREQERCLELPFEETWDVKSRIGSTSEINDTGFILSGM